MALARGVDLALGLNIALAVEISCQRFHEQVIEYESILDNGRWDLEH